MPAGSRLPSWAVLQPGLLRKQCSPTKSADGCARTARPGMGGARPRAPVFGLAAAKPLGLRRVNQKAGCVVQRLVVDRAWVHSAAQPPRRKHDGQASRIR